MTAVTINLNEKLAAFDDHWAPRVIAQMNDYQFKLAKFKGEFTWHAHQDTDEVFIVLQGKLSIALTDQVIEINAGEMYVVKKGVRHKPFAAEQCEVMLVEPQGVINTGQAGDELTAQNDVWI